MPHIFISYAKKDTLELAHPLDDALNQIFNITSWVDRSLRAGRSWELQIEEQIDRCDAMVVLISPDINRHKKGDKESYVLREISYAKQKGKKIIPVLAQQTDTSISLAMEHYIDFTINDKQLNSLVQEICNELELESSSSNITSFTYVGILPSPFDWIQIPNKNYSISKYPVTNKQFALFKNDNGYHNNEWWLQSGWKERLVNNWKAPRYWHDPQWNKSTFPVVGVSWYEAVAFCRWLSQKAKERIELPTEGQWLYAAQGEENLPFPWGESWNSDRCNSSAGAFNWRQTSSVTQYENIGDSPFGVVDLVGNVWEWCMEWDKDEKPLRGGCWRSREIKVTKRTTRKAFLSFNLWGFRLVKYNT